MKQAIYPGTFDPVTNGHVDVIKRAARLFGRVIVAVHEDSSKSCLFSAEERIRLVKEAVKGIKGITVEGFSGLLVDYCRRKGADIIIRSLRAVSDFDYEFQMAVINSELYKDIDTVFLMTDKRYFFLSSSIVKDVAIRGGDISGLVPPAVRGLIQEKVSLLRK